ncbi:MAG: glycoside hydrolase family 3 protein [Phototrophicaceae bacterium]
METSLPVFRDPSQNTDARIHDLLSQMTLAEKVGQMTQIENLSIAPQDVTDYLIGSVLSGGNGIPQAGNNPQNWAKMVYDYVDASLHTRLGIPLVYGADAVHGHNGVKGATIFPHNIGLGATRNPDLVRQIGQATAQAMLATGIYWNFAPAVSVPRDIRWGRTYEGYSENTDLVIELAMAFIDGMANPDMEGAWVMPSVKHFVADGGTDWNSVIPSVWLLQNNEQAADDNFKLDQGDATVSETELRERFLAPYAEAVKRGVLNVMASHSSWQGVKMHGHHYLMTDVLKHELGFEGFIVSDWMSVDAVAENYYDAVVTSINAGLDMCMVPYDFKRFISVVTQAVEQGDIPMSRIDDAVTRILRAKFALGLFEQSHTNEAWLTHIGSQAHRELARQAVQQSAVLLKHTHDTLAINPNATLYVGGIGANDIGLACGGWTVGWQGSAGAVTDGRTLLEGLTAHHATQITYDAEGMFEGMAEVGVAVIAEYPYAEGFGDRSKLQVDDAQVQMVTRLREHCQKLVLVVYCGRPLAITPLIELADAVVVGWLPGTEADALADVLYGKIPFSGKLPYTWIADMTQVPRATLDQSDVTPLYPFGHGLSI